MFCIGRIVVKYFVKLILCICIFLPIYAFADTWAFPERKDFYSPDQVVRFTVIPSRDFDEFEVGPIGLLERKNKMGEYKFMWINKLNNDTTPVRAVVSNSGNYVVTIDDYNRAGYGDNTIVLYGKYGNKIANFELKDALSEEQIQKLPRSVSSIWWYCGSTIIEEGAKRISIKIRPTEADKEECSDIVIDLKSLGISYLDDASPSAGNNSPSNIATATPASASFFPSDDDSIREIRQRILKEISESPEIIKVLRSFQTFEFVGPATEAEIEKLYKEVNNVIKAGADLNKKDLHERTALSYAARYPKIFLLLVESGADPKPDLDDVNSIFVDALSNEQTELADAMMKAGASLDYVYKAGGTALTETLHWYFSHKSNDTLKMLLRHGADPNKKSKWDYPLDKAIDAENWEGVDLLIKAGANIKKLKKKNALLLAVHSKDTESLKMLLKERFETRPGDYVYERAIIQAVSIGYDVGIKMLVESGVSPDSKIYLYDSTPLMEAAKNGLSRTIKNLIKMGADPNIKDKYGFSALDVAMLFGQKESEKILKENGAAAGIFTQSALNFLTGDVEKMKSIK